MNLDSSGMSHGPDAHAGRRPRALLVLLATLALLAIAALTALARDARAQDAGPLSPERFAALDTLYVSSIALEAGTATIADGRRVCQALNRADRLLARYAAVCRSSLKVSSAVEAFGACTSRRGCGRTARTVRMALTRYIADVRASNAVVAVEVPLGPCRTELSASRSLLRSFTKLRDGFKLLERGTRTRSDTVVERAMARILDASEELAQLPTAAQSRETYLRVCAPTPAPAPAASGA